MVLSKEIHSSSTFSYSYVSFFTLFFTFFTSNSPLGLIHANHGESIKEYLLNQLKNATTDVCLNFYSSQGGHAVTMWTLWHLVRGGVATKNFKNSYSKVE